MSSESPQSHYTHEELQHYLEVAETALANFEERYPELEFSYVHPHLLVDNILVDFVSGVTEEYHKSIAYLEPWEQDAVSIGSVTRHDHTKRLSILNNRLAHALDLFKTDLENFYGANLASVKAILLQIQALTATFTAERLDKYEWHKEWVNKQRKYLEDYHINECSKFEDSKNLRLSYVTRSMDLPEASGLYFLLSDGCIIYIGHSGNLYKRINNNELVRKYYIKNSEVGYNIHCVYAELPISTAKIIERKLISVAHPIENIQGKSA